MAADDLIYSEKDGQAIPLERNARKVWPMGNVIIGTAGIMLFRPIEYKFEGWITEFIEVHRARPGEFPSDVAQAIYKKMRETIQPIEAAVEFGRWKSHAPDERLVSYVVAGYTKNFGKPYIFEVGAEINSEGNGIRYISPLQLKHNLPHRVWFGEDKFFLRAEGGHDPEISFLESAVSAALTTVTNQLPDIPEGLREHIATAVGCIKVESHFNPNKVGDWVNVVIIEKATRKLFLATL